MNTYTCEKLLLPLFATKPFSDITFTDIEKVTGLSRGAILYHFKSKDEILASIIDDKLSFVPNLQAVSTLLPL